MLIQCTVFKRMHCIACTRASMQDLDDCMLAPTPANENMEPIIDNGEEVRTFEPGKLHTVVYSAHVLSAERFLMKPNVFSIKVFALEETRVVKATLDDFEALSKHIVNTLGKDNYPKRMVFTGLEEQRAKLDEWLQGTLRSLPSAPSIVQAKVLLLYACDLEAPFLIVHNLPQFSAC